MNLRALFTANKIFVLGALFFALTSFAQESHVPGAKDISKIIKEAESLSLNKDRLLATQVLWRNIKTLKPPEQDRLKDKLLQLAKFFYTDKGYRLFQEAQEFIAQEKWLEAQERLREADELEKGNTEVLELWARSLIKMAQYKEAQAVIKRAKEISPYDRAFEHLLLKVNAKLGKWSDTLLLIEEISGDPEDLSPEILLEKARAEIEIKANKEAEETLSLLIKKKPLEAEAYFLLSKLPSQQGDMKILKKYIELCRRERGRKKEMETCLNLEQKEKQLQKQ